MALKSAQYGWSVSAMRGSRVSIMWWMWSAEKVRTVLYASLTAVPEIPDMFLTWLSISASQSLTTCG